MQLEDGRLGILLADVSGKGMPAALLGASLVLLGHVARNESVGRVYSLGTHLINTFLLLASLALAEGLYVTTARDPVAETLGATLAPLSDALRAQLKVPAGQGILVTSLRSDGPFIRSINRTAVKTTIRRSMPSGRRS